MDKRKSGERGIGIVKWQSKKDRVINGKREG